MTPPAEQRVGIAKTLAVAVLILVIAIGSVAVYFATSAGASKARTSTGSGAAGAMQVTVSPALPLISPGEVQNYTLLEISSAPTSGTLSLEASAPAGLSFLINQSTIALSSVVRPIPVVLKAGPGISPGNYSVTVTASVGGSSTNHTLEVEVVPMLIVMENVAFHPDNVSVRAGTTVTWMNLDSTIGCCDPGNHNVSFRTIVNETSPILSRLQTWSYDFPAPGQYFYICTIHPWMTGEVDVVT